MEEDILREIEKSEKEGIENANEIIEIDENEEISNTQYDITGVQEVVKNEKKKKAKKPSKWSKLPKKQKIIIISAVSVVLLIIIGLLLYFLVFKKDKDNHKKIDDPIVIVEKDNYRYEDGKLVFIDENKKDLGSYECKNKSENQCYVAYYSDEDEFDVATKVYENGKAVDNRSDIILNKYAFVYDDEKKEKGNIVLYNIEDEKEEGNFELVKEVSKTQVIIKKDGKYGLLEFSDGVNEAIKPSYDYMGYIEESSSLVVSTNKNFKLIDYTDKDVSKSVPGEIKNFNGKNISVKVGSDYFVYDYNGRKVTEKSFDYIRFVEDYFIGVNSKKLLVFDKDGNAMSGDAIKISSSNYNTKLIFNDELRQVNKEEAFNAYINGAYLRLEFDDEKVNINLAEGQYNKSLSYINYFAGKLYFYDDEEKTNLLGTYACSYANSVSNGTNGLENCFIAKESNIIKKDEKIDNGYLPIYNKRFVFIADTKTPNGNDNIVLYDLKNNKKMATYKEVDAGYHDASSVINFLDTAGTTVFAKNTSDSYGMINITNSSVKGAIEFKNKDTGATNVEVKMFNENLIFKQSDNTYHLYDLKLMGTDNFEITKNLTIKNEIVEYKNDHIMVKTDAGNYIIYSKDGKVASDEYKYISIGSKFYVTIDNKNNIGLYKFGEKANLVEDIRVDGNDVVKEIDYSISGNIVTIRYVFEGKLETIDVNIE